MSNETICPFDEDPVGYWKARAERAEAELAVERERCERARALLRSFCSEDEDCGQVNGTCDETCWVFVGLADEPPKEGEGA